MGRETLGREGGGMGGSGMCVILYLVTGGDERHQMVQYMVLLYLALC